MTELTAALLGIEHPHSLAHLWTLQQLPEVTRILLWGSNAEALAQATATQGAKVAATFTEWLSILSSCHPTFHVSTQTSLNFHQ